MGEGLGRLVDEAVLRGTGRDVTLELALFHDDQCWRLLEGNDSSQRLSVGGLGDETQNDGFILEVVRQLRVVSVNWIVQEKKQDGMVTHSFVFEILVLPECRLVSLIYRPSQPSMHVAK